MKTISDELLDCIVEWNKNYDERYEQVGEDIFEKTAFLDDAAILLARIEKELL
jgi:hypothetical protein